MGVTLPTVLIVECVGKNDPGSEGNFLLHMFNILQVKAQYLQLETKEQMLAIMNCIPNSVEYIHFTTHGLIGDGCEGLWTPLGSVELEDLEIIRPDFSGKCVLTSACEAGGSSFRKRFRVATGCNYYIAPAESVSFKNAMFFSHLFYYNCFVLKKDVKRSFDAYTSRYKNMYKWTLQTRRVS